MGYTLPAVKEDKIAFCKTFNHPFEVFHDTRNSPHPIRGYIIFLRCTNCHTERWDTIDVLGDLIKREYHYPVNYRDYPRGLSKPEQRVLYLRANKDFQRLVRRSA